MLHAMATAPVGDDVYQEDPTVARLQTFLAETLGMEEALFVPTGTMANLIATGAWCPRGTEAMWVLSHLRNPVSGPHSILFNSNKPCWSSPIFLHMHTHTRTRTSAVR